MDKPIGEFLHDLELAVKDAKEKEAARDKAQEEYNKAVSIFTEALNKVNNMREEANNRIGGMFSDSQNPRVRVSK